MSLLIGVIALVIAVVTLNVFVKSDPKKLAGVMKTFGGLLAFLLAALFLVRGRIDFALPLGYLGMWLLGYGRFGLGNPWSRVNRSAGTTSRVRSATIEMELDHDTGALRGRVLAGPQEGAELDGLDREALLRLRESCLTSDPDGARLLEAYLDRRFAGWREATDAHADAGREGHTQPGPMTKQEAYEILGLEAGADDEAVRRAHRTLMKKLHPDQGGSTYLATRVNQAKDILLGRHR